MMLHFGLKLFVMVTRRAHDTSTLPEAIQRRHNPDENRGMEELDDRGVGKFIISALWTFFRDIFVESSLVGSICLLRNPQKLSFSSGFASLAFLFCFTLVS
jgi:hypothetical protein